MSLRPLSDLLGTVRDEGGLVVVTESGELLVVTSAEGGLLVELLDAWRSARDECNAAYEAWCQAPGSSPYAVYRAAADRADAAQDALATWYRVRWRPGAVATPDRS